LSEGRVDPLVAFVAWSLFPGERGRNKVLPLLEDPARFERVRALALREDPFVSAAFHLCLGLEPPASATATPLDAAALVTRYEQVLTSTQHIEERLVAVDALARVPHERAVDVLADVLAGDPSEVARVHAAEALARRVDEGTARGELARALGDPSPRVVLIAIGAIGTTAERGSVSALHKRLGLGTPEVRNAVEEALARIHQGGVMPLLDRLMGEDRPDVIAASVRVLERMADEESLPLLLAFVRSSESVVRTAAVRALATLGDRQAHEAVFASLSDPNEDVRMAALVAGARTRSEDALARIREVCSDPSVAMRVALAFAVVPFDDAPSTLEELAEDALPQVRAAAIVAMLMRADVPSLTAFARIWPNAALDTRREVRAASHTTEANRRLGMVIETSHDGACRASAVVGLAALSVPGWLELASKALSDPVPAVRVAAVRAASLANDEGVRARIAELLADPDRSVREAAKRAHLRLLG
jgi:HEAT repeat protein